jgi:hypothetical protein
MGINVASDTKAGLRFADMIVDGHKTLESRNSDTLRPYVGKRVAIVRTGEGKAKAIGEVTVGEPKVVNQRQFRAMEDEHKVPKGSRFDINTPTKHLYPMHDPVRYEEERDVGHGIVSRQVIYKAEGGSVQPKDQDYHAKVHQDLLWHAARGKNSNFGSAIYHDLAGKDFDKLTEFYKEHVAPVLAKNNYPKPPDGPNGSAPAEYHKTVTDILQHWDSIPREKAMQWFAIDKKAKGGKVEVRPTVKDEGLMRKIPQMEAAAKKVEEGKMSHEAYDKVVAKHKPVKPYEFVPQPASDEDADRALMENKKPHWRGHEHWPAGRKVGLRLDIPAYENHGVWVNSIHDEEGKGEDKRNTSYGSVSSVKNATFDAGPSKAIKVATGEQNKSPFARIKGELHHMSEDEAVEHMKKNLNHKDYAQVGMDPRRHGYFYDRKTMKPVTHSKHVVQIGPLVLAHKPTYGERESYAHGGIIHKAQGGAVNLFDYEDADHVESVAKIASKHRDFNKIPDAFKHLSSALSQGSYKFIEDPRIQSAIKQAGHNGYYIAGKDGKQPIIRKAEGGAVLPIEQIKAQMMNRFKGLGQLQSIGANEAPSMGIKAYVPTAGSPDAGRMPVGGIDTSQGDLPVGGIDMSKQQPGHQLMPNPAGQQQGMDQVPMTDQAPMDGMPPMGGEPPPQGASNILSMTPQGQAMAAMKPQGLAKGGSAKSIDEMKAELASKKKAPVASDDDDDEEEVKAPSKRILVKAEGAGGVTGIVIPHHMLHGRSWINKKGNKVVVPGLKDINKARAEVYGSENRDPLSIGQTGKIHKETLEDHFSKPLKDQLASEKEATARLRAAKHLGSKNNTLDESEKLDTVRHETDEEGRTHVGFASKGVAGHALYTSGHGKNEKHHIINTCPGQTEGCGGGKDSKGVIDTSRGTCFAPNAESQYVHAAVRRATHEQSKHDPKMTRDWILAHTGSMRDAANKADKSNQRLLFRPNVVDETDVSSRHVIRHLNEQRKVDDKPPIIANSYGKTNELHDPENGYHVTHSNVGPKVKKGQEISENVARDKARVRNTIMASDNKGDFKNEQGHKTPPKGSYMVTDVKRGSEMAKNMEKHITHAKYWTTGREQYELTPQEKEESAEGHFGGNGKPTSEDEAHYGHKTIDGKRYDYQKQHILHPRLVNVPIRKKNKKTGEMETKDHMIPTDSRFKDTEFLPKNKFKSKNGKDAGHILMTTPTESTSNIGHETSFTHNVSPKHIEHAIENKGEYEIDKPEDQIKASNKEYRAPQSIKFYADGGMVGGRHVGFSDDDFHAFPEQNVVAQRHLAMRGHDHEPKSSGGLSDYKRKVTMNKDMDTMLLELTRNKKAK